MLLCDMEIILLIILDKMMHLAVRLFGGDDLTGALFVLQLQLSPPPPSHLAPMNSRTETFW